MTDDLKKSLSTTTATPSINRRVYEEHATNSTSIQDTVHRYHGVDATGPLEVRAIQEKIVVAYGLGFHGTAFATLQHVLGDGDGLYFEDVMISGLPVGLTEMNTVIKLPFQGRYRFVFKDGWDKHEDAMIVVREQQRTDGLGDGQGGPIIWEQTGISACRNDKLWFQERDQYNHIRWVNSGGDCRWQSTAVLECRTDGLYRQEKNYSGDLRWVKIAGDCGWQPTGERECRPDHKVWQKERNRADEIRWTDTGLTCYDPTYPLPCGGWAFGPGDVRDPAASKQLADCHDGVGQNIWVYPAPGPGHTIPVADCEADHYCLSAGDIEGYAANVTFTGVRDKCFDGVSGCTTGASILGKG